MAFLTAGLAGRVTQKQERTEGAWEMGNGCPLAEVIDVPLEEYRRWVREDLPKEAGIYLEEKR